MRVDRPTADRAGDAARSRRRLVVVALLGTFLSAFFAALGFWQVERLEWKLALIERVEARVAAEPVAAPLPAQWGAVTREDAEYRRLRLDGRYLANDATLVQAVTDLGPGFWVLAPFRTDTGFTVLVNRGFVPADRREAGSLVPPGERTVTGLLRITEPDGGFLRENDPEADRWFSRDVEAIGEARELSDLAPFFVDADRAATKEEYPVGGLTVIRFRNHHLVYLLTWFSLAAMVLGATIFVLAEDRRSRRRLSERDVEDDRARAAAVR